VIFIRGGLSDAEIEEESGMSKQAANKLAHGALNVVWEKLETLDFLGVDTQFPKSRWASQGRKSNGLTSIRPAIHLKLFTFHDINSKSFSNAVAARIESARLIFRCWRSAIPLLAPSTLNSAKGGPQI
jgi:transcriptional regulator with XRE-family HTH domain